MLKAVCIWCLGLIPVQAPVPDQHEPRDLGNRAAMHVVWYAPATKEITHVETYLFKDLDTCKDASHQALAIASMYASEGDHVMAQCFAVDPPEKKMKVPDGAQEL